MEPSQSPKLAPYLVARDAPGLAGFLQRALGGTITYEAGPEGGRPTHLEVRIADGLVMIGEMPLGRAPFPAMLHLYVPEADLAYRRALDAGATSVREPAVAPDGLKRGGVRDAWGNEWWFSSPSPHG